MTDETITFTWTDGNTLTANTMTDLVKEIIGHTYTPDEPERALIARFETLADLASKTQAIILNSLDNITSYTENQLTAALTDKRNPIPLNTWDADFPLILIATGYQPYTDLPRPKGETLLLNPHTERSFLEAFTHLGLATLLTKQ